MKIPPPLYPARLDPNPDESRYPLLEPLLRELGLNLKGRYTTGDIAEIFGVCGRTIEKLWAAGKLQRRSLPGHARCLSCDLEEYLLTSQAHRQTSKHLDPSNENSPK